jgi:hypothetical protein
MPNKTTLDSFLDDVERQKLEQFVQDEIMMQAVKKVLLFSVYGAGRLLKGKPINNRENFALVYACQKGAKLEDIGADVKACWEGINALENAYNDLEQYKPIPVEEMKENPAR